MDKELQKIIESSTFTIIDGVFVYAKLAKLPASHDHFLVCQDADEITVVTRQEKLPNLDLIERNKEDYSLIALNVSIPFYSVGFLAAVSNAIAKAGMNILIVSTYSKDYILVKQQDLAKIEKVLLGLNFKQRV